MALYGGHTCTHSCTHTNESAAFPYGAPVEPLTLSLSSLKMQITIAIWRSEDVWWEAYICMDLMMSCSWPVLYTAIVSSCTLDEWPPACQKWFCPPAEFCHVSRGCNADIARGRKAQTFLLLCSGEYNCLTNNVMIQKVFSSFLCEVCFPSLVFQVRTYLLWSDFVKIN